MMAIIHLLGISIEALVPSFLGALIKTSREKNVTLFERLISVFSGVLTAGFLTPLIVSLLDLSNNIVSGVAFGLGYLGLNVVETIFDKLKK